MSVSEQRRVHAVAQLTRLAGRGDEAFREALDALWADAFEEGRLAALEELQDRFCVCMK